MSAERLRECECGCKSVTPVAARTERGYVRGEQVRFIKGHNRKAPVTLEAERFWPKVEKTETCWNWTAGLARGYGHFYDAAGRHVGAHVWAYRTLIGPIPSDMTLDHLCRNRACVNPSHLEIVTRGENSRRGNPYLQTNECAKGHDLTGDNAYSPPSEPTRRMCRICAVARKGRAK